MINPDQAAMLMDQGDVVSADGDTIGKVGQVYVDNENGQLTWVTVKTGWFGNNESFVPLDDATLDGHTVTVPYDKAKVKDAPNHDSDAELSVEDENDLYTYYGVNHGTTNTNTGTGYTGTGYPETGTTTVPASLETTGYTDTDTEITVPKTTTGVNTATSTGTGTGTGTDGYITRSEEQLHVGTQQVEAGRARLKKFVVTEQQTVTVPVSHEEVHVVRETLRPGDVTDATIGEDTIEVTLMEDKVVVGKDTIAVERVRLDTETITEQQHITEAVRKEQIEMSNDVVDTVPGQKGELKDKADTLGDKAEGLVDKVKNAVKS